MKQQLVILIGPSGSGKSFYARKLFNIDNTWKVVSTDEHRLKHYGKVDFKKDFINVFRQTDRDVIRAITEGNNVIYDACNITKSRRKQLLNKVHNKDIEIVAVVFSTSLQQCIYNDKSKDRLAHVGWFWVLAMKLIRKFNRPSPHEGFTYIMTPTNYIDYIITHNV